MWRKGLFISLAFLLSGIAIKLVAAGEEPAAAPLMIDATAGQQIVGATIWISMYAPAYDDAGDAQIFDMNGQQLHVLRLRKGLGTITRCEGQTFIVTHNHWSLLTPQLQRVEIHDTSNKPLLEMSGLQFYELILTRRGGTMVLRAPDEVADKVTAVPLDNGAGASQGDIVFLAYFQPQDGEIRVAPMSVQRETRYKGEAVYRLSSLNSEVVVRGNSGGGVLFNDRLVGNMWGTIVTERAAQPDDGDERRIHPTTDSLAAKLPRRVVAQLGRSISPRDDYNQFISRQDADLPR